MASVQIQLGGKAGKLYEFRTNEDLVAVRTRDQTPLAEAALSGAARRLLDTLESVTLFPDAGVEVLHVRSGSQGDRDNVRATFKAEPSIRFAGRVLADPVFKPDTPVRTRQSPTIKEPVVYSENIFVKFDATRKRSLARKELTARNLKVKREVKYVPNGYFVAAPEGIGLKVFDVALDLLRNGQGVEFCHPELLRPRQFRAAFPQQWHLKEALNFRV